MINLPPFNVSIGKYNCGLCGHTEDGVIYTSDPPKVRCMYTGEFKTHGSQCDAREWLYEQLEQVKAERDVAVKYIKRDGGCFSCKYFDLWPRNYPCTGCDQNYESDAIYKEDLWEWNGKHVPRDVEDIACI